MAFKTMLLVVIPIMLVLSGCASRDLNSNVQQQKRNLVCISREDLQLLLSSVAGNTQAMEAALKAGADVNTSVEGLGVPIVASAMSGNYRAVQLLLEKGANVNSTDSQGYTALINAALLNNREIVQLLVSKGADVNAPAFLTINGKKVRMTPLLIAKNKGYEDVVKLLTEAGAKG